MRLSVATGRQWTAHESARCQQRAPRAHVCIVGATARRIEKISTTTESFDSDMHCSVDIGGLYGVGHAHSLTATDFYMGPQPSSDPLARAATPPQHRP